MKIMKNIFILVISTILIINCETGSNKKIKLATFGSKDTESALTSSSVIRVLPEEQHSAAVLHFENKTGDPALAWLERGLADMFVKELSQSPYLNIVTMNDLIAMANRLNLTDKDLFNPTIAIEIARETESDLLLSGNFYQMNDSLFIDVELWDTRSSKYIRKETVQGLGMERLFAMVDELSDRVRSNIRGDLNEIATDQVNLVEMTTSVEAFRCYSEALENRDKFFYAEAEKCLEDALKADSTFAAGYLQLADLKMTLGKKDESLIAFEKTKKFQHKLSISDKLHLELFEIRLNYDHETYLTKLKDAIEKLPSNVDFHLEIGRIYRNTGDFDKAIEHFEIVRDLQPNLKTIYNDLGYSYSLRGDYTTGLKYIQKYKELAPGEPNPYDSNGELLMWAGRLHEAVDELKIALSISPSFYHSAEKLGRIYGELGEYKLAINYLEDATKNAPSDKYKMGLEWHKAFVFWKAGKIDNAIQAINSIDKMGDYKKITPSNILLVQGEMYRSIGDNKSAQKIYEDGFLKFEKKIKSNNYKSEIINQLTGLMFETDIPAKKSLALVKMLEQSKDDSRSNALLNFVGGLLSLRVGYFDQAKEYFETDTEDQIKLITQSPKEKWSHTWKYVFEALSSNPEVISAGEIVDILNDLAKSQDRKDLVLIANYIKAIDYSRRGNIRELELTYQNMGTPLENKWLVSGPYFAKNSFAFDFPFLPELINLDSDEEDAEIPRWQPVNDGLFDGYLDLRKGLKKSSWATGYALVHIHSPEKREVQFRIGSDESFKIWLNDNMILSQYLDSETEPDHSTIKIMLQPGYNKLMVKVVNRIHEWGFHLRVTDENGYGFEDVTFHRSDEIGQTFARN